MYHIVRLWIEHGVDVTFQDSRGETAADIADAEGYSRIAEFLSHSKA
jgi:ankyrin repeat protein